MGGRAKREVLLLLVLLAAFALRVFRLGHQPLWSDEIYSVAVARHSFSEVWSWVYRDNHPALYWILLHPVVQLLGDTPVLVRFPSAVMGTLTVALTYAAGKQLFGSHGVGLFAALWLTVSPFHIVYSQEARMYAPLALFGIVSTLFVFRGIRGGRVLDWVLYGVTAAATAHSHNYGLLLVAAQGMWVAGVLVRDRERRLVVGSAVSALTFVVLYAPMIPALVVQMQMPVGSTGVARWSDVVGFFEAFGAGFAGFSTPGLTPGDLIGITARPSAAITGALVLLGLVAGGRRPHIANSVSGTATGWSSLLPGVCVVFPVLFVYGYSALAHKALWQVRGFQMVLGCFALLLGAGLWSVRPGGLRWILFLGLTVVAALNLHPHYFDRHKSTVPDAVAALDGRLGSEDVLFVAPYWQWTAFRYHYRGSADAIGGWEQGDRFHLAGVGTDYADLIDSRSLEVQSQVDHPIVPVSEFAPERYKRVWAIGHQAAPQRVLEVFGDDVTVMHYDVNTRQWKTVVHPVGMFESDLPLSVESSSLHWDNGLQLLGYRWHDNPTVGQDACLTLFWMSDRRQVDRLGLRLQLIDGKGKPALARDVPMISLVHGIPMTGLGIRSDFPTTAWPAQSVVAQDVELSLPAYLPALSYPIQIQLFERETGEPVAIDGQAAATLGQVSVARPREPYRPREVAIDQRRNISFGGLISLLGYNLPEALPRPGHHLPVWLHWSAREAPSAAYEVHLRLLDGDGTVLTEVVGFPAGPSFPTSQWEMGDLAQGRFDIHLPPHIDGGRYRLAARLVDSETQEALPATRPWSPRSGEWIVIGGAEVLSWPLVTEAPEMDHVLDGQFGATIHLLGYDLTEKALPGSELALTLYWRAEASPGASYHVFVHLVDGTGKLVAQADGIPAGWLRPTTTWRQGEVIADHHSIYLPSELSDDAYHLYVGLYEPEAQRLSVFSGGEAVPEGRLLLTLLEAEGTSEE